MRHFLIYVRKVLWLMNGKEAAIYFIPEAYSIEGNDLKGRNAAGSSFLKGYLQYAKAEEFYCYTQNLMDARPFVEQVSLLRQKKTKVITHATTTALSETKLLFTPGPNLQELSFTRSTINRSAWSICGITHTTSSSFAMDAIASLITAPVQPWDAIICTSSSVKKHIQLILKEEIKRLRDRLDIRKITIPQLPIIPLGINFDDFQFSSSERENAREILNACQDTIVILYLGRLSFHAKSHPLAMYQVLERVALRTKKRIKLIECGWFAHQDIEAAFEQASKIFCPHVEVIRLDGRVHSNRKNAWASADIFCSFSDNIQETFGITPIEAMAAGLPVIVSDWDGYRESIRDNIEGFLIKTTMPKSGLGQDIAFRHANKIDNYDLYCGYTSMHIAIDINHAVIAFEKLVENETLRIKMGKKGRKRAKEVFDWQRIIPKYESLWDELKKLREEKSKEHSSIAIPEIWPARIDPFKSFSHYPSHALELDSMIVRSEEDEDEAVKRLIRVLDLKMVSFANDFLPPRETLLELLRHIPSTKTPVSEVLHFDPTNKERNLRTLSFLQKMGSIHLI